MDSEGNSDNRRICACWRRKCCRSGITASGKRAPSIIAAVICVADEEGIEVLLEELFEGAELEMFGLRL